MSMANDAARFWDSRFRNEDYAYGTVPNQFVREMAERLSGSRQILCIGDGEGRNGVYLATLGHKVTSLDASVEGQRKAKELAVRNGTELGLLHQDLWSYAFRPGDFDVVVSVFCHLDPELRRRVHSDIARALPKGGAFILEGYTPRQLQFRTGGPKSSELLYTADTLRQELNGLRLEICREVERDVVEGKLHTGRAAVIDVLGWK